MNTRILSVLGVAVLIGCSAIKPSKQVSDNQKKLQAAEKKVGLTVDTINKNTRSQDTQTSTLAAGIHYSLSKITNGTVEVDTASRLTERIMSIQGTPNLDELQKIKLTVDLLNSAIDNERERGQALLDSRDLIIIELQRNAAALADKHAKQIDDITAEARGIAQRADENKATISAMNSMFGFGAVFYGLKRFVLSFTTILIVFVVVFIVLRIFASINPVAASLFAIFDWIGSAVLSVIKGLTPRAFELSKMVNVAVKDSYKKPLVHIINTLQEMKMDVKKNPTKTYVLDDIFKALTGTMKASDEAVVEKILVEEKWKEAAT